MSHISTKKTEQLLAVLIVEITRLISPELSYTVSRLEAAGLPPHQIQYHMNGLLIALRRAEDAKVKREKEAAEMSKVGALAPSSADLDAVAEETKVKEATGEIE